MRRAIVPCVCALSFFARSVAVPAQTRLPADATVHSAPNGASIGTVKRGTVVRTGRTSEGWTAVTLEGWIASNRLATRRDTLDRAVTGGETGLLRVADGTSQPVAAELEAGTLLKRFSERNGWTMVRRAAWVRSAALRATPPAASARPAPQVRTDPPRSAGGARGASATSGTSDATQRAVRETALRTGPGGEERASVRAGAPLQTVARDGGWALVRIEGWVPERDVAVGDSAGAQLSAADLRANPDAHRGKIVQWDVQIIAFQRADVLRKGFAADEPYLLARAPGADGAMLYLAVPPSLIDEARSLAKLSNVMVTARVREGRSEPVGVPILDLTAISKSP